MGKEGRSGDNILTLPDFGIVGCRKKRALRNSGSIGCDDSLQRERVGWYPSSRLKSRGFQRIASITALASRESARESGVSLVRGPATSISRTRQPVATNRVRTSFRKSAGDQEARRA